MPSVTQPGTLAAASKRAFDILVSAACLIVLSPLLIVIAVIVKLDSHGSVLFRAPRIGLSGEEFLMLKFRTMVPDADRRRGELRHMSEAPDGLFKIKGDPRLTRFGTVLRSVSLDELPQLLQVLTGRMSMVGPRPLPPEEDALILEPGLRVHAKPGITGPWQLAGSWRVTLAEMVQLDDDYLLDWSIWRDVKLLARTAAYVLRRHGV